MREIREVLAELDAMAPEMRTAGDVGKVYYHGRTNAHPYSGEGIYITDSLEYASGYSDGKVVYAFTLPFDEERLFSIRNPAHVTLLREHFGDYAADQVLTTAGGGEMDWAAGSYLSSDEFESVEELLEHEGYLGLRLNERPGIESIWIFDEGALRPEGTVEPRWWEAPPWEQTAARDEDV